jgi:hypothetical protein
MNDSVLGAFNFIVCDLCNGFDKISKEAYKNTFSKYKNIIMREELKAGENFPHPYFACSKCEPKI